MCRVETAKNKKFNLTIGGRSLSGVCVFGGGGFTHAPAKIGLRLHGRLVKFMLIPLTCK